MSEPNFDLGLDHILKYVDMSSSGDEFLMSVGLDQPGPDPVPQQNDIIVHNDNVPTRSRFNDTSKSDRNKILEDSESKSTKNNTKGSVKILKCNYAKIETLNIILISN